MSDPSRSNDNSGPTVVLLGSARIDVSRYPDGMPVDLRPVLPDLEGYDISRWPEVFLRLNFGRAGLPDGMDRLFWLHFVRLLDQAVEDYRSTQEAIERLIAGNFTWDSSYGVQAISRMERCILTTYRVSRFSGRLKARRHLPRQQLPPRQSLFALKSVRDSVEHLDERIIEGSSTGNDLPSTASQGTPPLALQMGAQVVTIANKDQEAASISYRELAGVLVTFRLALEYILAHGPGPRQSSPPTGP